MDTTPASFFQDLFAVYPPTDPRWAIYEQRAIKVCIKYTNTTGAPRPMLEIRSGKDGTTELKDGKPKEWGQGETRYIVIEPSNKTFTYDNTNHWGSAAYPKTPEDIKDHFAAVKSKDMLSIYATLKRKRLVLPWYQIADNFRTLHGIQIEPSELQKRFLLGSTHLGFPDIVKIMRSKARVAGMLVKSTKLPQKQPIFPMGYRAVPIEKGSLLVIDLDSGNKLKPGPIKYAINDHQTQIHGVIARIIDAPQVKGAAWMPSKKQVSLRKQLAKAQKLLTDASNYQIV